MQKLLKNKRNTKVLKTFIILNCLALISCTSYNKKPHNYVDYNDSSKVLYQIKTAEDLLQDGKTMQALIRAELLDINTKDYPEVKELRNKSLKQAKNEFNKSIQEEEWTKALSIFRSLANLGERPQNWTELKIAQKQKLLWEKQGHPALLNLDNSSNISFNPKYPKNFAEMIKASVTVWVDKGTRIQKGVGFSDIAIGSGFFIDPKGYFITNYHVIQSEVDEHYNGYSKLYIKSPDNKNIKIPAKVIAWDPLFDLALVKTEFTPERIFPLGSSKKLEIGSKIYAIGSPAGLERTLTAGIVSTKYRRLFSLVDIMQIDAPINHGNSGGPIVNEKGLVQGVVFAGLERNEGLNFAIPIEHLKRVLPQFYKGGKVDHSWLGAYGTQTKLENKETGIEVSYILPKSPLEISGVKEGSIITEFNNVKVKTVEEIQAEILSLSKNTIVNIRGYEKQNNGKLLKKTWPVLCAKRPKYPGKEVIKRDSLYRAMLPLFGINLESSGKRKTFRIRKVDPGTYGDESGFAKNDYIEINGKSRHGDEEEILQVHIYAKKVKAGYVDSFMVITTYLDNGNFF